MTRGLTGTVAAAVAAEQAARTVAIELDFPSGMARWNASPMDIVIDGATFLGVGMLGSISVTEESAELRAYGLTVVLSGIPRDAITLALIQGYQGRRGTVWEVPLNPVTHAVLANPVVIFRGRMDTMDIELGEAALVRVAVPLAAPGAGVGAALVSGWLWACGFGLFTLRYAPMLLRPRLDGKPG